MRVCAKNDIQTKNVFKNFFLEHQFYGLYQQYFSENDMCGIKMKSNIKLKILNAFVEKYKKFPPNDFTRKTTYYYNLLDNNIFDSMPEDTKQYIEINDVSLYWFAYNTLFKSFSKQCFKGVKRISILYNAPFMNKFLKYEKQQKELQNIISIIKICAKSANKDMSNHEVLEWISEEIIELPNIDSIQFTKEDLDLILKLISKENITPETARQIIKSSLNSDVQKK